MKLRLWYLLPGETEPYMAMSPPNGDFVASMVAENPDTIFFYTTDTTDIF